MPKDIWAILYPVVERHRFVWVWIGAPAKADPAFVPDFWPCSAPGGYLRIAADNSAGHRQSDGPVP